jgi:hypothetical protein
MSGRDVAVYDIDLQNTLMANTSSLKNYFCFGCIFSQTAEIDKVDENVYFYNTDFGLNSIANISMNSSVTFDNIRAGGLNGINRFTTIKGGSKINFGVLYVGFGHNEVLTLDGSSMTFQCGENSVPSSALVWISPTFSISNNNANWAAANAWGVPGYSYFFSSGGAANLGQSFTITAVRSDNINTYFDTSGLPVTLPSLGQTKYFANPVQNIIATNMLTTSTPNNAAGPAWCHF